MKDYKEVNDAINLIFSGINISQRQLEIIQKLRDLDEIKDMEVRLSNFSGMHKLRKRGWFRTTFDVYCAAEDEAIFDTLVDPPEGRGIVNFLKKHGLERYISFDPSQVIDGMNISLCLGGIPDPETEYDDVHYHINLEVLRPDRFNELFRRTREYRERSLVDDLCIEEYKALKS